MLGEQRVTVLSLFEDYLVYITHLPSIYCVHITVRETKLNKISNRDSIWLENLFSSNIK